jgi:hypothetical protein
VLEFTGTGALARSYINLSTRKTVFGKDGLPIKWRVTVLEDADTDASGDATVVVTPAAISEANDQFTNISTPLLSGDVFTILGAVDTEYQPNLFYDQNAFGLGFVKLPKLHSTDVRMVTKDGVSMNLSKYSDGDKFEQTLRLDIGFALATFNALRGGKAFG